MAEGTQETASGLWPFLTAAVGAVGVHIVHRFWPTKREQAKELLSHAEAEAKLRTGMVDQLERLEARLAAIETEVANLEKENRDLRAESSMLRAENSLLRTRVATLETEVVSLRKY